MLRLHLFALLARIVTVLVSWVILMGVPALMFEPPLSSEDWKLFLGIFYALFLVLGVWLARSWGGRGVLWLGLPFFLLFTGVVVQAVANPALAPREKAMTALGFGALYLVAWLAWRIGRRLGSPARERGELI